MQEEFWLQEARKLPYGGKAKIMCCGSTPSMMINHTHSGYTGWCFRCSPGDGAKFHPHGELSIKEIAARRAAVDELKQNIEVVLPKDFTTDIPDKGRVWLLRAGISSQLSNYYGIGYSPYYDRVIIPVLKDGELDAFIARALNGEQPKYIAKMRNPDNALFLSDPSIQLRTDEAQAVRNAFDIVLTEDILSAIRVGRFVASAAILGTSLGVAGRNRLHTRFASRERQVQNSLAWWEPQDNVPRCGLWLDPDRAGRNGAHKLSRKLGLAGWEVQEIRSERDPKHLSDKEIGRILKEYVHG